MMLTWTCHICRDERPDHLIAVYSTDISAEHGLPAGAMRQNVRYCADRRACAAAAATFRFTKES